MKRWMHTCGLATLIGLGVSMTLLASPSGTADGLAHKVFAGYQGWYGCPGDFAGNRDWQYWFPDGVSARRLIADVLPSTKGIDAAHLCDTGLPTADGHGTVKLFSSQDPVVVATHFNELRAAGIDGAAVQRFVFALNDPVRKGRMDHMLANVRAAAEASGRSFFIVYDITGASAKTVMDDVRRDWSHLIDDLEISKSPAYLHDSGKPVLELWGFGIGDRPGSAPVVQSLVDDLKSGAHGTRSVTLIGGVPTYWRTLTHDSKTDPAWAHVYRSFDVISPWSVGRYDSNASFDTYLQEILVPDEAETRRSGIRYLPVAFPGYSHSNAARQRGRISPLNGTPRDCGRFFWHQFIGISNLHADGLYIAMFDEVGEGTAIFPLETLTGKLPAGVPMVVVRPGGCNLSDDGYMRVTGAAARVMHGGRPAPARLEDALQH